MRIMPLLQEVGLYTETLLHLTCIREVLEEGSL
jgi:hypothetical protein